MRRRIALALLALLTSCSQEAAPSAARIPGPNSLAVTGRLLLIANTETDELRALDLSGTSRKFVRAPNPLFPLGIPTGPIPRALGAWTSSDGVAPPFSFALSTTSSQVTVVSNATLASLGTFTVPDTALALAVTQPTAGADERLIIAVRRPGTEGPGALYGASFPATLQSDPGSIANVATTAAVSLGDSIPQVLVASPARAEIVAVGDRLDGADGLGRVGGLAVVNLAAGTVVRLEVGGPVAALAFNRSGDRLFGLLDTDACGSARVCNGLFAVDVSDPAAPRSLGLAEVPGTGLSLAVGGQATLVLADGVSTSTVEPLVMVGSSDGSFYAYDGAALAPVGGVAAYAVPPAEGLSVPAAVTFDPINNLFYGAYAGGNAVVEIDPTKIRPGQLEAGVAYFR